MHGLPDGFGERLAALCAVDAQTGDHAGLVRSADLLAGWATDDGLAVEVRATPEGPLVIASTRGAGADRTLLIGHHDVVYPAGTAAARPLAARDGRVLGPGVADMRGGLLVGLAALAGLARDPQGPHGAAELWIVPDEEARSWAPACLDEWRGADRALCLECGRADGAIVTARKACTWLTLEAVGRDAHAGTERDEGRSALMALVREAVRIEDELHGGRPGVQATVTQLNGGSGMNTVPGHATASVDLRADTAADLAWVVAELGRFAAHDDIAVTRSDEPGFPPLDRDAALAEHTLALLAAVDAPAREQTAAGASDGSWSSSIGVPTVDGLGPIGGGDHGPDEWIDPASVAPRIEVVRRLAGGR
ncbi:MAG: M20 family metallopeptidase [Actinobacteria bacterium]|nr:M20 family metallopeptidase [Actinomycetota bacterium]